jgi:hypothetical protein
MEPPAKMTAQAQDGRNADHVAKIMLAIVLGGVASNFVYNLVWTSLGERFPYTTFLFVNADRFADFFKLLLYFPGNPIAPANDMLGVDSRLSEFMRQVSASGLDEQFNPFHLPPLAMSLAMIFRRLIEWINPAIVLLMLIAAYLTALSATMLRIASGRQALWAIAAMCCYPVMFAIDRGNFYAAITGLCLVAGLNASSKGRVTWPIILAVAIALNLRPNACIFPAAMFLAGMNWRIVDGIRLAIATLAIAAASYLIAHRALPQYEPAAIQRGLDDYYQIYVLGYSGISYGSSLLGAMKALFGVPPDLVRLPPLCGLAIILVATALRRIERLDEASFLFALTSAYVLMSQVTSDYHLFIFFFPLLALARQPGGRDWRYWTVLLASTTMLIPKNYMFNWIPPFVGWSYQVVLNPLILLCCTFLLLAEALRSESPSEATA